MTAEKVVFTAVDHLILNSYKTLVDGLAEYMGNGCEIVLHSLEDLERSVIKIVNGEHTCRKEGAPITDLALSMLSRIELENRSGAISYLTHNRKGEPLKACTILIRGEKGKIIGLLCINYYLNTPLSVLLEGLVKETTQSMPVRENFASSTEQLVQHAVADATQKIQQCSDIIPSAKNKAIVEELERQGIFKMKDAVILVAQAMEISKNTVYLHLRNLQRKG